MGLVQKFYKDHNYKIKFDDGQPWPTDPNESFIFRLLKYLRKNLMQVSTINNLEYGDIVCLKSGGHLGIYLGDYKILCMEFEAIDNVSKSRIYEKDEWIDKFKYGFKRKKESL